MAKNQLTHIKAHKLFTYLTNRAPEGEIPETVGAISKEASLALDFHVSPSHVDRAARELDIKLVRKDMGAFTRGNGAVEDDNVAELVHRLARIEKKLDALSEALGFEYDG